VSKIFHSLMMMAAFGLPLVGAGCAVQEAAADDAVELADDADLAADESELVADKASLSVLGANLNGCTGVTSPLYRYWSLGATDHFYTTDFNELGWGRDGYVIEGTEGQLLSDAYARCGALPLYRYWSAGAADHFYTTNFGELGYGRIGYIFERVQGYCFPFPVSGTKPLYRFVNDVQPDHFYTTRTSWVGGNYRLEGIACYVPE